MKWRRLRVWGSLRFQLFSQKSLGQEDNKVLPGKWSFLIPKQTKRAIILGSVFSFGCRVRDSMFACVWAQTRVHVCEARCWHWFSFMITLPLTWIHSLLTGLDWLARDRSPLPWGQWDYKQAATPTQDFHGCWGVKLWVLMFAQRASFSALSWPSGNNPEVPKEAGQEKQFSDSKIRSWRKGKPHFQVSNTTSWRAELHRPEFFFLSSQEIGRDPLGGKSWADHG